MAHRSGLGIAMVLVVLLIGLLFAVSMFGMIYWGPTMMGGGMIGGCGYPLGAGWGVMLTGMLIPLGFLILLIIGAYFLLMPRTEAAGNEGALAILDERFAKGEITKTQYLEMKEHLTKK